MKTAILALDWPSFWDDFKQNRNFEQAILYFSESSNMEESIGIMKANKYPTADYVTWIYTHMAIRNPNLLAPFTQSLIDELLITKNHSMERNLLHALKNLPLVESLGGEHYDFLLQIIQSSSHKHAARVNAILLMEHWFLSQYPEMIPEVRQAIQLGQYGESASLRAAAKNFEKFAKRFKI